MKKSQKTFNSSKKLLNSFAAVFDSHFPRVGRRKMWFEFRNFRRKIFQFHREFIRIPPVFLLEMIEDEKSIADFLRRIELTEKEIKIYLALLEINGSAASILGKKAGIANRSTAKYICESLLKRGLITGEKQNGAVIYSLEWPEKFLYLLERKKEDIKEQEKVAHRVVGKLKSLMNISVLPKVKFFEGKDSFAKAYETILMKTISFCNYL